MVWGVCRRLLPHHDAEDAFQATFLVLVRKAASIRQRDIVANWLYGVAHQTALHSRRTTARRRTRERQVMPMPEPAVAEPDLWHDLQPLLDQELAHLPDKYRVAIVLCDLEGKSRKEAARQLGCPEGTLAARLARGRKLLAKRLSRRSLAVSGGVLAAVLSQKAASAGVPASVVFSTIKAATLLAAGQAAATERISAKVVALTEGVLQTMWLKKLKIATVLFFVVVAGLTAGGFVYRTLAVGPTSERETSANAPARVTAPTPDEANTPLTAVSKRESYVFASTPEGLFRASLKTKQWERLKMAPGMPPNGTFAAQPGKSPVLIYVAMRSAVDSRPPRRGARYGLYLSRDDGASWKLISERDDYGATLLHPSGALFAVTGADGANFGDKVLRSPDLGKTWRDITGDARGQFRNLEPDPDHPGLIRIDAWALRGLRLTADDENYHWKSAPEWERIPGRRPTDDFFLRTAVSTTLYISYPATLANYFQYDFGNQTSVHALEVVVPKTRFEFARGARVVIPVQVVLHYDSECALAAWRKAAAEGRRYPRPEPPRVQFADVPEGTDFWGLRVESADAQIEKYPPDRHVWISGAPTDGSKAVEDTKPKAPLKYRVVDLSPSSPYGRKIDLSRLADFGKPGEYRVQILYCSVGAPNRKKGVWDGSFTSPVFTVVIRP
jgi:RNA polymerase sigma factor (sigma-70 family)